MKTPYRIVWSREQGTWFVIDSRNRRVAVFPTLLAAERFVTRGEEAPDEVDAS